MKVLNEKPHESVVRRVVCKHCGVTIEYVPADVVVLWSGFDYSGGPDGAEGFRCPKCNERIVLRRW